jgi:exopolyphosphatase/guanosine-5'-triphosphate,3'-diphosphate pyrophosphatase
MIGACIDVGSNTTRLLVADCAGGRLRVLHEARVFTRLGHELAAGGRVSDAKRDELIAVIAEQAQAARRLRAQSLRAIATAAVRHAENGPAVIEAIAAATGVTVEIITGREEARLAFIGAAAMCDPPGPHPPALLGVVDVGGGSTELVVGEAPGTVHWWASIPLGSSMLAGGGDPPSAEELAWAAGEAAQTIGRLTPPAVAQAVAVGGSASSLPRVAGQTLDAVALDRALAALTAAPAAETAQRHGIDPERARLLPAGLVILRAAAQRFGGVMTVGRGGIREGVLLEAAGR